METQVSERLVLCREFMVYGAMKGCTNAYFGGVGTTIDTVNGPPTRDMAQKVERAVKGKFGFTLNKMLGAGTGISQHPIPASFPAYVHTDMRRTLENIVGFTKVENYGGRPLLDEDNEIGSLGSLRFIENPIQTYIPNGGAAVGTWTGVGTAKSTGGSLMDVYPIIVMGRGKAQGGAFGQVALRGKTAIKVTHVPLGQTDKSDPLGQRGYIGGITYQAQLIENDAWMAVLYVGCQD
jgi:N4-gp56 family major capsid protein